MQKIYITSSSEKTKEIGRRLAREIIASSKNFSKEDKAFLIYLEGDLGGGKTTFLQGFAKGLGIKEKILSPTFVIIKRFMIQDLRFKNFYHIDCYRIKNPREILELDFKDIISNPKNIVAVEWAEKIKKILSQKFLLIEFSFSPNFERENKRFIKITKN